MFLALVAEASTVEKKVHLDVSYLTVILTVVLPLLTGIVTKASASSRVKAITLLTLTLIATAVQQLLDANGVVNLKSFLATFFVTWVIAMGIHLGFLKPTGATAKAQRVAPDKGLGKAA